MEVPILQGLGYSRGPLIEPVDGIDGIRRTVQAPVTNLAFPGRRPRPGFWVWIGQYPVARRIRVGAIRIGWDECGGYFSMGGRG